MEIKHNILEIIEEGKTEGILFFLPDKKLERKIYQEVNKVLECLGGKWNRKLKAHLFESDISNAIDNVILTGEVIDKKKEFQFFETPNNIVNQLIELGEIKQNDRCLEPSAGQGNIANALRKIVGNNIVCVEIMPENIAILENNGFNVYKGDFLQYPSNEKFDKIIMNPPFTSQQDITHVEKALTHLNNNGILVSVMSVGIKFRTNKKTKDFLSKLNEYDYDIIDLQQGAFKISGTMVNTIILKVIL